MIRLLAIYGRGLAFEKNGTGYILQPKQKSCSTQVRNQGALVGAGLRCLLQRFVLPFKVPRRGLSLMSRYKFKKTNVYKRNFVENFSIHLTDNSCRTNYVKLAWRRLSHLSSFSSRRSFTPLSMTAYAVSLAFTRFKLAPGIVALSIGELTCAQRAYADGGCLSLRDDLYMKVQDGRMFLSSVVHSIMDGVLLFFRISFLAILFSPALAMAPFVDMFGIKFRKMWLRLVHHTLEAAGPAFIKWGQWAATRPDLFPNDLCTELAKLHSKAPSHSFAYSKRSIEKAFNRKLTDIFENFEETPVASGSIAQVHRASLRFLYPNQRLKKPIEVAVKVRHPGVGESIRRDFVIINLVAKISRFIPALNWLRLDESVRQFAVFMMSQVDLAKEAVHLCRFIYNFRKSKNVSFPKPLYPLVHPAVLVETFENGESVSAYLDNPRTNNHIKRGLARIGTDALLKMLLVDNFVHADMHPGNILVRIPQKRRSTRKLFTAKPHVILLDVGMTVELCNSDQLNLLEFFKAVALRDGRTAAECTLRLSKHQNCPNPQAFIEDLDRMFTFWGTPQGDIFHPVECIQQLLEQVRRHKVNIDGNICTVMVTIMVLEGWQQKLDPNFDIMRTLKTLLIDDGSARPIDCLFS
ncbi:Cadmium-transporting ATPase protein [Dioscorea alata]|uniref:Cadmium-transporting ATPase protein n=1 Tax=Dioscorea alata TaxID=55571 RepID=A0ACB7VNZ5_DIOAL|nr:Cadmium-transporting ATPase protein [Dioscorea alata]